MPPIADSTVRSPGESTRTRERVIASASTATAHPTTTATDSRPGELGRGRVRPAARPRAGAVAAAANRCDRSLLKAARPMAPTARSPAATVGIHDDVRPQTAKPPGSRPVLRASVQPATRLTTAPSAAESQMSLGRDRRDRSGRGCPADLAHDGESRPWPGDLGCGRRGRLTPPPGRLVDLGALRLGLGLVTVAATGSGRRAGAGAAGTASAVEVEDVAGHRVGRHGDDAEDRPGRHGLVEGVVRPEDPTARGGDGVGVGPRGDAEDRQDVRDPGAVRHDEVVAAPTRGEADLEPRGRVGARHTVPLFSQVPFITKNRPRGSTVVRHLHPACAPYRLAQASAHSGRELVTATVGGTRQEAPAVPSGRIVLQPPPEITPAEGLSNVLMQAVPMLGSVGSMGFVALSQPGPRGIIGAGMFLVASLGFVFASGVRQRQQHTTEVISNRREYLAYLAEVRGTVRDAAAKQREAGLWNYPAPASLPLLAEEKSRVWERLPKDDDFLHVRMGTTSQPLCLTLEPAETPPLAQARPGRGLRSAPSAHDPPRAARPAGIGVADRLGAGPGHRRGRSGARPRPLARRQRGRHALARHARRRRPRRSRCPRGVGLAQVAAARAQSP